MSAAISIIIPFYNNKKYIDDCIGSILSQTFTSWQAIFIDDASTDCGSANVKKIANKDGRIVLIHNEVNVGAAKSRIIGLMHAKSPYIMFLDGDDMLAKDALYSLWKGINGADICIGQHIVLRNGEKIKWEARTSPNLYTGNALDELKERIIYSMHGYSGMSLDGVPWKALFKRKFIYNNLCHVDSDLWFSEDHLLFVAVIMDVSSLRVIDKIVYYYRKHDNNVTTLYRPEFFDNAVRLYYDFYNLIKEKNGLPIMQKTNKWFLLKNIEHSIKREVMNSGKKYIDCKKELKRISMHPLFRNIFTDDNISVLDRGCRKYLALLYRKYFLLIYISLKWKKLKEDI